MKYCASKYANLWISWPPPHINILARSYIAYLKLFELFTLRELKITRPTMAKADAAQAVSSAWAVTLASYKKELNPRDLMLVQEITSPIDVANHIEYLEKKRRASKHGAIVDQIHLITGRLVQFSSVVDAITSSSPEAALIWGSLKLLLTIIHRTGEDYAKICKSILAVGNAFPTVEMLAKVFDHSDLVCSHVVAFYKSVLHFWSKALKYYKRRRVFRYLHVWHDFESEFGDLDHDIKWHGEAIEKAAAAVHMAESRTARIEQTAVNRELIKAERSTMTS